MLFNTNLRYWRIDNMASKTSHLVSKLSDFQQKTSAIWIYKPLYKSVVINQSRWLRVIQEFFTLQVGKVVLKTAEGYGFETWCANVFLVSWATNRWLQLHMYWKITKRFGIISENETETICRRDTCVIYGKASVKGCQNIQMYIVHTANYTVTHLYCVEIRTHTLNS